MDASRRAFLGATAVSAASYSRILGANERVQVGFIGYGLIGKEHVRDFHQQPDVDCAALAEVHTGRLEEGITACGRAKPYRDFRKLLDNKDIQAVVVSTPDHWHAAMTILACAARKDVYVEKPMTLFITEGRPNADVEDGHRTVTACHLANISLRLGRRLRWDAAREEIIGDHEASQHLTRPYRKPWDEVVRLVNA